MHFDITDEQKALCDVLGGMFRERIDPVKLVEQGADTLLERDFWRELCAMGVVGVMVPEDHGGSGLDLLSLAVVAETVGAHVVPAPVIPNALAAWLLSSAGAGSSAGRWVAPLIQGDALAAFALPAPGARQLTETGRIVAVVEGGAEADILIALDESGSLGVLEQADPSVEITVLQGLDLTRPIAQVEYDPGAVQPLSAGAALVESIYDALLITFAADALGAALALQARAVEYAKERKQFGRLIGSFQALKHQLADISVELEPARPLIWYAAHGWDTQRPDARRMAAIAKAHVGDIAVASARTCIEAFGGIGYTWEHSAHVFLKRAMFDRSVLGSPSLHRERAAVLAGWSTGQGQGVD